MNLKLVSLSLACVIGLIPLTFSSSPVFAQTLVNPIPNRREESDFYQLQQAIYRWVVADFRRSSQPLRGTQVKISSLLIAGDWATAFWMVSGRAYPEGIAGQVLMKKQGQRWVFVAGDGGMFSAEDFIRLGVPPQDAAALEAGPDV